MQQILLNYRRLEAISKFKEYCSYKIPQTVGAIDGTHIGVKAPQNDCTTDSFCCKQKYTQAAIGANLMILDLATGYPGSLHDSIV